MGLLRRVSRYLPHLFFLTLVLVTILALIPAPSVPQAVQFWDKAQHALAFAVLAVTGCCAFPSRARLVTAGLLVHGALIEVLQSTLTTTRFGDIYDWYSDALGILVGFGFFVLVVSRFAARFQYPD